MRVRMYCPNCGKYTATRRKPLEVVLFRCIRCSQEFLGIGLEE